MSGLTQPPMRVDAFSENAAARPLFRTIVADDWREALRRSRSMPNGVSRAIQSNLARLIGRGLVDVSRLQRKDAPCSQR